MPRITRQSNSRITRQSNSRITPQSSSRITRQSKSLRYRFLNRLPLELRTRIYELVVVETLPISLVPKCQAHNIPNSFRNSWRTRKWFPALILNLEPSLSPIVLEAREVYFRKNVFGITSHETNYFLACMRQLKVHHWIHNIELHLQPPQPSNRPWELAFFDLLQFPLRRLEVDTRWFSRPGTRGYLLGDYQIQLMLLEQQETTPREDDRLRAESRAAGDGARALVLAQASAHVPG